MSDWNNPWWIGSAERPIQVESEYSGYSGPPGRGGQSCYRDVELHFKCRGCKERFNTWRGKQNHEMEECKYKMGAPKKLECFKCGDYETTKWGRLREHLKTCGEKPKKIEEEPPEKKRRFEEEE